MMFVFIVECAPCALFEMADQLFQNNMERVKLWKFAHRHEACGISLVGSDVWVLNLGREVQIFDAKVHTPDGRKRASAAVANELRGAVTDVYCSLVHGIQSVADGDTTCCWTRHVHATGVHAEGGSHLDREQQ